MRKSSVSKQSKHSSRFLRRDRRGIGQPPRELLVPARDQRRASAMRCAVARASAATCVVGHDARHEALLLRFGRVEDAAFEQDLQRDAGPTSRTSGAISAYAITRPRFLIGAPKRLDAPQMRRSHSAAISSPPPTQMPWICATSGWRQSASARAVRMHDRAVFDAPARLVRALASRTRRCRCRARMHARRRRER